MSFTVTRIQVDDFRSYESFVLKPADSLTILVGPNAVGKTNLIEAVQLLTEADSFRHPLWGDTVRWGCERASLSLQAADEKRRHEVDLIITAAGRRNYRVNGKPKRSVSEVTGVIPCVVFTPEDLRLVKDSAERRRSAIDEIGIQLSHTYRRLKKEYERVVRQRNALLKQDEVNDEILAPWDERLVTLGARLGDHRRNLFARLENAASRVYATLASEELRSQYLPAWVRDGAATEGTPSEEALELHLVAKRREERARRITLVGPHRDEIVFRLDGNDARAFASQGQQRSIALAWKLAEVAVVDEVSGVKPLLLLDDVMSELDQNRRRSLTALVGGSTQTFVTTTTLEYFEPELLESASVVRLP